MDLAFSCKAFNVPSLLLRPRGVPGEGGGEIETFFSEGNFFLSEPCRISPDKPVSFFGGETGRETVLAVSHSAVNAGRVLAGSRRCTSPDDSVDVGDLGGGCSTSAWTVT